ncbi:MAG TPA: S1 RNA-binding domain-containing protein [Thermoanaerobaculia bacterium]|nr:S1 RNA-binding domain-containing protein [Thermoanaerobaculia bacterium]
MSKPDAAERAVSNETSSAAPEEGGRPEEAATEATPPATAEAAEAAEVAEVAEAGATTTDGEPEGVHQAATTEPEADADEPAPETAPDEAPPAAAAAEERPAEPPGDPAETPPAAGSEEHGALAPPSPELEAILAAHTRGERVEGRVIGWNKGGFHVVVDGVPAFCPKSQIELENPKRASAYVDRTFPFRILEVKDKGKRVVLTRRQVLIEDRQASLEELRRKKASGEPIEGKVTSITDFGAFVDVGGVEGLVHLSQLSRRRVESARELVQVGQQVQVKVLKIEKGGDRISLSMKALEPDPWHTIGERFGTGSTFEGRIVRKADFGLFVDVGDGVEGLVHTSNLALGKTLESPEYAEGSAISGWVREVDGERRRLSLSLREIAHSNPWADVRSRYGEGAEVEGQVEQVARFGVFVEIEPGLTGLLPFSALPESHGPRPPRQFQPGEKLQVVIDAIDTKRRRISLAPLGSTLEGTKSDYRDYQKKQTSGSGLGALAAAFEKLHEG